MPKTNERFFCFCILNVFYRDFRDCVNHKNAESNGSFWFGINGGNMKNIRFFAFCFGCGFNGWGDEQCFRCV